MAARHPVAHLSRRAAGAVACAPLRASPLHASPLRGAWLAKDVASRTRSFATPAPPVTQNATGSKGPTAMVFLNMGGPSAVDEVEDFLTRLFVSACCRRPRAGRILSLTMGIARWRLNTPRSATELHRQLHLQEENPQDPETICRNRWRLPDSQVVGIPECRNV